LAAELGIETYPTHTEGENVIEYRGRVRRYRGTVPPINPIVLLEIERVRRRLDRMARQVPLEAPWSAARAASWDGLNFAQWLRRNALTAGSRMLLRLAIRSVFGAEPEDLSLLHVLFYVHSAGNFNALIETAGGAQDSRLVGGA